MVVNTEILEKLFDDFTVFISSEDKKPFSAFATSSYIDQAENYKYSVYVEARENLGQQRWKVEDIGTGKIQRALIAAIKTRVIHNYKIEDNNLVDWRKKDDFAKTTKNKNLEKILFDFYKSKIPEQESFESLIKEKFSYQFIAYLFFIKDRDRYMPISQVKFDEIFELIGLPNFKTSHNLSWENYSTYLDIIKQVRNFLKTKDKNVTLLDAHSFLWILGNQMKGATIIIENESVFEKEHNNENQVVLGGDMESKKSQLSFKEWAEILLNEDLTNEFDLDILQTLYSFQDHKAYASQIASILETTHPPINLEIGRYAKRIAELYNVTFTARTPEKDKFWDLFFDGWEEGTKFIWQLKSELIEALKTTGLTGDKIYPDELPVEFTEELYEGVKKAVTVNSFERNSKARQLCVNHWKAICAVCGFDFEKTYGKIGKGFIHVHHLVPVSQIGKEYQVDPLKDLIPVCPNCHSMIHRQEPPLTIEELKLLMNSSN